MDDEIMVLASERPVIQTALNVSAGSINELQPGQAILISKTGKMRLAQINRAKEKKACSFERIYFSREVTWIFIKKENSWAKNW